MLRERKGTSCLAFAVTIFAGVTIVWSSVPCFPGAATNLEQTTKTNTSKAVVSVRMICSAEIAYRSAGGSGEFGGPADLFRKDLIDADLANALDCPKTTSDEGRSCLGTDLPFQGYKFRLDVTASTPDRPAAFTVRGIPSVMDGEGSLNPYSFFVDETQVIRVSDDPAIIANAKSPALGSPQAPRIR